MNLNVSSYPSMPSNVALREPILSASSALQNPTISVTPFRERFPLAMAYMMASARCHTTCDGSVSQCKS